MRQAGIEEFIERYGRDIYSFCCYLTKSRPEADDLYQDAFVKALEMQVFQEGEEKAKNRLLSVAVRLWKDKKRKFAWRRRIKEEKYIPQILEESSVNDQMYFPEQYVMINERSAYVRKCVDRLPEKMKMVVLLYYMENRRMDEISEVLGIPLGTVKSRLHQAKKMLASDLNDYQNMEVSVNE